MAWKVFVQVWFVTLVTTSDLLIIHAEGIEFTLTHDPFLWQESLSCVSLACIIFPVHQKYCWPDVKYWNITVPEKHHILQCGICVRRLSHPFFAWNVTLLCNMNKRHPHSSLLCSWSELRLMSGCFSDKIFIFYWLSLYPVLTSHAG